ncbi:hypothetical protein ACG2LH_17865 [Zhouia sp. PK063]|uniref:hypothetical protein n=1 Tax=Zhouia sp. PK063 TaxID=3373602 RepID=UPI0037B4835E
MKRIYFDNLKNWIWITILILSLLFILAGTFEFFQFDNPKVNKKISAIGFFLQAIYYSKVIWHKNYFQWNKKRAYIRINSWTGKSLSFDQIRTTELNNKKLIITKKNGNKVSFDVNEIMESDTQKLNEIIIKNTIANNV